MGGIESINKYLVDFVKRLEAREINVNKCLVDSDTSFPDLIERTVNLFTRYINLSSVHTNNFGFDQSECLQKWTALFDTKGCDFIIIYVSGNSRENFSTGLSAYMNAAPVSVSREEDIRETNASLLWYNFSNIIQSSSFSLTIAGTNGVVQIIFKKGTERQKLLKIAKMVEESLSAV